MRSIGCLEKLARMRGSGQERRLEALTHQTQTESGGENGLDVESEHRLFLLRKVCELFESCLWCSLRRVQGLALWYISKRISLTLGSERENVHEIHHQRRRTVEWKRPTADD